jgi:hypothetical protein
MKWTNEEIEKAINLNKSGKRFNYIANELHRERRSVEIRLQKLGYHENRINSKETLNCKNCEKEFLSNKKDKRKFCSLSCSAEFNNRNRPRREKSKFCLNCNKPLEAHQYKFCSSDCSGKFQWKNTITKIENGNTSFGENTYKKYLIHKHGNRCMKCGWNEINPTTGLVPIQLEHKDGNSGNHNLLNLELLCPNCHSLTPTYGALNKGNGRTKRREKRNSQK